MWQAQITNIDTFGLKPELAVTVTYSNDSDDRVYESPYEVLPEDLNGDTFNAVIQAQVDILNTKDAATVDTAALTDTANQSLSANNVAQPLKGI